MVGAIKRKIGMMGSIDAASETAELVCRLRSPVMTEALRERLRIWDSNRGRIARVTAATPDGLGFIVVVG